MKINPERAAVLRETALRALKDATIGLTSAAGLVIVSVASGAIVIVAIQATTDYKNLVSDWAPIAAALFGAAAPVVAALYLEARRRRQARQAVADVSGGLLMLSHKWLAELKKRLQAGAELEALHTNPYEIGRFRQAIGSLEKMEPFAELPGVVGIGTMIYTHAAREFIDDADRYKEAGRDDLSDQKIHALHKCEHLLVSVKQLGHHYLPIMTEGESWPS